MLSLILYIAIVGLIVWAITTYIPMPDPFKMGIIALSAIFIIVMLIKTIGGDVDVPQIDVH